MSQWPCTSAHPLPSDGKRRLLTSPSHAGPARSLSMHSMAVLQVFQAKLLQCMDESGPVPAAFKELRSATGLALRATKTTAQAIGRSMPSLVVLESHFWLNLMEIKEADKVPFLDSPVTSTGLFKSSIAKAGITSIRLFEMVKRLVEWAHLSLRSLRAAYVPDVLN